MNNDRRDRVKNAGAGRRLNQNTVAGKDLKNNMRGAALKIVCPVIRTHSSHPTACNSFNSHPVCRTYNTKKKEKAI